MKAAICQRTICLAFAVLLMMGCLALPEDVHAASVNKENLVTNAKNPENGVITYDINVPAGERVDYSVTLTPDKSGKAVDVVNGSWKNRTKKTVKKTVTMKVKYLSDKYKITASYTRESSGEEISCRDVDSITSALKETVVTRKLAWDFSKLGKGNKEWKYRYKYVPYKGGFKKYLEVFDKTGTRIKCYVKQTVSITKITELIKEMMTR